MTNADRFATVYAEELTRAVSAHPERYAYALADVPDVSGRMVAAFIQGDASKDGDAIRAVCRRLNINCTYRAIAAFLAAPGE